MSKRKYSSKNRNTRNRSAAGSIRQAPKLDLLASVPILAMIAMPVVQTIRGMMGPIEAKEMPDGEIVLQAYGLVTAMYPVIAVIAAVVLVICGVQWARHEDRPGGKLLPVQIADPWFWFIGFILLMLLSTVLNGFTDAALHGVGNRRESLFSYLVYVCVFFFCASQVRSRAMARVLEYAFLGSALFLALCTLGRAMIGGFPGFSYWETYAGPFYNLNHYAYYLVMVVLMAMVLLVVEESFFAKSFCLVVLAANVLVLLRNNTFGGILACGVGVVFFALLMMSRHKAFRRAILIALAIAILAALLIMWQSPTLWTSLTSFFEDLKILLQPDNLAQLESAGHNRMGQWIHVFDLIKERPLFGWGVEGIEDSMLQNTTAARPHNEYLQYAAFFGIPAAVCYVFAVLRVLGDGVHDVRRLDNYRLAALVAAAGYAVSALFGVSMFYTAPFFFIMLGLAARQEGLIQL